MILAKSILLKLSAFYPPKNDIAVFFSKDVYPLQNKLPKIETNKMNSAFEKATSPPTVFFVKK